jgi:hypothetical protein
MSYTVPDAVYGSRPSAITGAAGALYAQAVVVLAVAGVGIASYDRYSGGRIGIYGLPEFAVAAATDAGLALLLAGALVVIGRRVWRGSAPARTAAAILDALVLVAAIRIVAGAMPLTSGSWPDAALASLGAVAVVLAITTTALLAQPEATTFRRATGPLA